MDEYDTLIRNAVARLTENTAETRREAYQRLRARMVIELRRLSPGATDAEIEDNLSGFDRAIVRFEQNGAQPSAERFSVAPISVAPSTSSGPAPRQRRPIRLRVIAGVVLAGLAVLYSIPPIRDELTWAGARFDGRLGAVMDYNRDWPHGRHSDEGAWMIAQFGNAEALNAYLQDHPDGRFVAEARQALDTLAWRPADEGDTVLAMQAYLQRYPNGAHAEEARQRIEAARRNEQLYVAAVEYGDPARIAEFLTNFPGHVREADARTTLANLAPRDLFDLIQEGKIEAHGTGAGIESISMNLHNTTPYWLAVLVPPGTFMVAHDTSAQNMVTTETQVIRIRPQSDASVSIAAACANRPRDIPYGDDQFTIARTPPQADLARLMPALADAHAPYAVRQAAVWILSDDADYGQLGILVRSTNGFGGSRVILAPEAARAMQIIDGAGINITRRAIWRDRREVLEQLPEGELKVWLAGR
ncbi:MAG: hypothetical protein IPL62_20805 [Caulobacteraceae bacterium]|nr:hypothetical protein [Caulobacteraceae bacterium]